MMERRLVPANQINPPPGFLWLHDFYFLFVYYWPIYEIFHKQKKKRESEFII